MPPVPQATPQQSFGQLYPLLGSLLVLQNDKMIRVILTSAVSGLCGLWSTAVEYRLPVCIKKKWGTLITGFGFSST